MVRSVVSAFLISVAGWVYGQAAEPLPYPIDETDKVPPRETKDRRERLKERLGNDSVAVFFTNPVRNRNNDVDFKFRPDSNFWYLTGHEEPHSILILAPGGVEVEGKKVTEILFVEEPSRFDLTWHGYTLGSERAVSLLGMEMALPRAKFTEVFQAVSADKKVSIHAPTGQARELAHMESLVREKLPTEGRPTNIGSMVAQMRTVKSPWEIEVLRKVCQISADAHTEAMRAIRPNMREYEIAALVEYIYAREGCEFTGYPPICGSGPNSTILHYIANRRLMQNGDIFCIDSAGEYHGYSADITRSYPVNGKFSPEQRAIYEIVLAAQEAGIAACVDGATMQSVGAVVSNALADGLIKLGLIKERSEISRYYMHGFGHPIGLDVHDPYPARFEPGVVMTVEPGIYIAEGSPCDEKWWNIGIRIEDNILVTEDGPENLTASSPRTIAEIEKVMAEASKFALFRPRTLDSLFTKK